MDYIFLDYVVEVYKSKLDREPLIFPEWFETQEQAIYVAKERKASCYRTYQSGAYIRVLKCVGGTHEPEFIFETEVET